MVLTITWILLIAAIIGGGVWLWAFLVPQGMHYVVERMGKFHRVVRPGLNFKTPLIDRIAYRVSVKDTSVEIPSQEVITKDNALIKTNAVAFIKVVDPRQAVYEVDDYRLALSNLIQTALRGVIGDMELNAALSSRDEIKRYVRHNVSAEVSSWGIVVKTVEIKDIKPSEFMQRAMEEQAAAERRRLATVSEAEGNKAAAILNAEGNRHAAIMNADGEKVAIIRRSEGRLEAAKNNAESERVQYEATRNTLSELYAAIGDKALSAHYHLGEQYLQSMQALAKSENAKLVVLPPDLLKALDSFLPKK